MQTPSSHRCGRVAWAALGLVWLCGVVAGLGALAAYDNGAGAAARTSGQWPAATALRLDPARHTLVMVVHPRCTCSRASLGELAELIARARHRPSVQVVFVRPARASAEWQQTELWQAASAIPGVTVVSDAQGLEAARFGAETSGQTFLYDPNGRLVFSGGTTGSRGHRGDNAGRAAILRILDAAGPVRAAAPVFGCELFGPHDDRPSASAHHHAND